MPSLKLDRLTSFKIVKPINFYHIVNRLAQNPVSVQISNILIFIVLSPYYPSSPTILFIPIIFSLTTNSNNNTAILSFTIL